MIRAAAPSTVPDDRMFNDGPADDIRACYTRLA
jgi:hypothetical protein